MVGAARAAVVGAPGAVPVHAGSVNAAVYGPQTHILVGRYPQGLNTVAVA
jgi:hypothetical protein